MLGVYDGAKLLGWPGSTTSRSGGLDGRSRWPASPGGRRARASWPRHRHAAHAAVLDRARSLGYPISALYAATVPVYRAIGYEFAGAEHKVSVSADAVRELGRRSTVEIRRAGPADAAESSDHQRGCIEQHRDCGPIAWPEDEWVDELEDDDNYSYLAEDGFLMYGWDGSGGLEVHNDRRWIRRRRCARCGRSSARAPRSPRRSMRCLAARPDPLDPARQGPRVRGPGLVDVPAARRAGAIAGRGYPAGVVVDVALELTDAQIASNAGRIRLTVADGTGALEPDRTRPGVELGPNGLAALYAGTPISTLRRAGLARRPQPRRRSARRRVRRPAVHARLLLIPGSGPFSHADSFWMRSLQKEYGMASGALHELRDGAHEQATSGADRRWGAFGQDGADRGGRHLSGLRACGRLRRRARDRCWYWSPCDSARRSWKPTTTFPSAVCPLHRPGRRLTRADMGSSEFGDRPLRILG